MAEFKTAEQYVVEKLETVEKELDDLRCATANEIERHIKETLAMKEELDGAYKLLNMFREFIRVGKSEYFGPRIVIDGTLYNKENPEEVARIMEYYDFRFEEDE